MTAEPVTPETERDRLAHREAVMRWALDQCLLVVLDRVPPDDGHYGELVAAVKAARPDLALPPRDEYDPSAQTSFDRTSLLAESLERLAGVVADLGEPGRLDYVSSTREANDRLRSENRRLKGLMEGDPEALRQAADEYGVRHWAARLLAFGFADEFRREGAKNFIVVDMYPPGMPGLSVTMQVKGGASPADRIAALESQVADLTARLGQRAAAQE